MIPTNTSISTKKFIENDKITSREYNDKIKDLAIIAIKWTSIFIAQFLSIKNPKLLPVAIVSTAYFSILSNDFFKLKYSHDAWEEVENNNIYAFSRYDAAKMTLATITPLIISVALNILRNL
jgi:hypothetical protein